MRRPLARPLRHGCQGSRQFAPAMGAEVHFPETDAGTIHGPRRWESGVGTDGIGCMRCPQQAPALGRETASTDLGAGLPWPGRNPFRAGFVLCGGVRGAKPVLPITLHGIWLAVRSAKLFFVSPAKNRALLQQRCRQAIRFMELKIARRCPARLVACRNRGLRAHGAKSGLLDVRISCGG